MGMILGKIVEETLSRPMILHDDSFPAIAERPIVLFFFALTLLSRAGRFLGNWWALQRAASRHRATWRVTRSQPQG